MPRQQSHSQPLNAETHGTENNGIDINTPMCSPLLNALHRPNDDQKQQQRSQLETETIFSHDGDGEFDDDRRTDEGMANDWYSETRDDYDMHANFRNNNLNKERQITPIVVKMKKDEQAGLHRILLTHFKNNDFMWETASREIIRLRP